MVAQQRSLNRRNELEAALAKIKKYEEETLPGLLKEITKRDGMIHDLNVDIDVLHGIIDMLEASRD